MLTGLLQAQWGAVLAYNFAMAIIKLSIVMQYIRVFHSHSIYKFLVGYLCFLVVAGLWLTLASIFTCWPVSHYWDIFSPTPATCMNKDGLTYGNASLSILNDIVLLILPLALLRNLNIPKHQKYILLGVFGVGSLACITSIIRLHALYQIANTDPNGNPALQISMATIPPSSTCLSDLDNLLTAGHPENPDLGLNIAIWSCIEINISIICASTPALKPLAAKLFPSVIQMSQGSPIRPTGDYERSAAAMDAKKLSKGEYAHSKDHGTINVESTFEMKAMSSDHIGNTSQDGSERGLVNKKWQAEGFTSEKDSRHSESSRPKMV
jgi:hypothetical protein